MIFHERERGLNYYVFQDRVGCYLYLAVYTHLYIYFFFTTGYVKVMDWESILGNAPIYHIICTDCAKAFLLVAREGEGRPFKRLGLDES